MVPTPWQPGLQGPVLGYTVGLRITHLAGGANLPWDAREARGAKGPWHTSVPLLTLGTAAALPREQCHPEELGAQVCPQQHTPLQGGTHLSTRGSYVTFVSLTRGKGVRGMLALTYAPKWCGDRDRRKEPPDVRGHAGTTQGPLGAQLLTFLPSTPGVPSSPWGHRLPVNDLTTGTVWAKDRHWRHGSECRGSLPRPHGLYVELGSPALRTQG